MESHGGNVELLSLEHGVARIHLRGSCSDCSASSVTLELAIKQALEEAAPDLEGLEVEGMAPQTAGGPGLPMVTGVPPAGADRLRRGWSSRWSSSAPAPAPSWFDVESVGELADGALAGGQRRRAATCSSPTSTAPCSPTATAAPAAAPRLHDGAAVGRRAACRSARGRSSCRGPGARWTTITCSSSRCRCCASRAG